MQSRTTQIGAVVPDASNAQQRMPLQDAQHHVMLQQRLLESMFRSRCELSAKEIVSS
jgi:hypothetical protein